MKQSFKESKTQYVATSQDGFPAFGLRSGSDIKRPYRLFLPERLPQQFSILVSVQPTSQRGGYLFAVVNPLETVVQLGVKLSPTEFGTNVSLVYTDPLSFPSQVSGLLVFLAPFIEWNEAFYCKINLLECSHVYFLQTIASFEVGKLTKKWTRFAFEVNTENVTFYFNCKEYSRQAVIRNPMILEFDSASTLYIGQAGPLLEEPYEVSDFTAETSVEIAEKSFDNEGIGV